MEFWYTEEKDASGKKKLVNNLKTLKIITTNRSRCNKNVKRNTAYRLNVTNTGNSFKSLNR